MSSSYRMEKDLETGDLVEVSPWKKPEFQSFTAIVVGSALIMSLIGAFKLANDVSVATNADAPYISARADKIMDNLVY
jgi:protein involved in polysaccharide export with SLBB domain